MNEDVARQPPDRPTRWLRLLLWILVAGFFSTAEATSERSRRSSVFRHHCPDRCVCVPHLLEIDMLIITCKWPRIEPKNLLQFPRNATKTLSIQCPAESSAISDLGDHPFVGFNELTELRISDCEFEELREDTLEGLKTLRVFFLSGFGEPRVHEDMFEGAYELEKLSITGSRLRHLPAGLFCPLVNVQILTVSSNRLTDIRLSLSGDCSLDRLILLDVGSNRIRHIGSDDLRAFPSIRQLSAISNQLDEIHDDAFTPTPHLQHLDLESNLLRSLPGLPDGLSHLSVADNRLEAIPAAVANLDRLVSLNASRNSLDSKTPFPLLTDRLETLDLSRNSFAEIPVAVFARSLDSLRALHLIGNRLTELEEGVFRNLSKLQILDLSENRLKSLTAETFDGLEELAELYCRNNSIYHIDADAFKPLARRLQLLDVSGNQLTELPIAVSRLLRAKHLDFSRNQIIKTHKFNIHKVQHLTHLDLSDNRLEAVEPHVFSDCAHLSELILRGNRIRSLGVGAFEKCPQLRHLDLSANQLSQLNGALKDLRSLRRLNLNTNELMMLEWSEIPTDLVTLSVAANRIELLGAATRSRVRELQLEHNRLSLLLAEQLPDTLEVLNVSHNQLRQINNGTFAALLQLKSVDLRDNVLTAFAQQSFPVGGNGMIRLWASGNPLECNCEMGWLRSATAAQQSAVQLADFEDIQCTLRRGDRATVRPLGSVDADDFLCAYEEVCEPQCVCCDFSKCDCKSRCPSGCNCYRDAAFKSNVVECSATEAEVELADIPMHATHIRLKGVRIPVLKRHAFTGRARLVELTLNDTGLQTVEPTALNTLQSLKTLALPNNRLSRLNGDEALKTHRVTRLDLSNNRFSQLDPLIADMFPELEELRVAGNAFTDMPAAILEWPKGTLKSVTVGMNPFRCDCVALPDRFRAQQWVERNADRVADLGAVVCVENVTRAFITNNTAALSANLPNNGADLFVMPMVEFLRTANSTVCAAPDFGILFGGGPLWSSVLLAALILLISALLCALCVACRAACRRPMKQNRYKKAPPSLNSSTMTPGPSPQPLIQFDVFVSYSKQDEMEVVDRLWHPLNQLQYTQLLLHQDADPHQNYSTHLHQLNDELIRQMRSCHALVLYLTRSFIRNEWSTLAIKASHKFFVQDRGRKVIVLLGEGVDTNDLDHELGQILRRNTHIIHMGTPLWWNLFITALPRRDFCGGSADGSYPVEGGNDCDSQTTQIYSDMYGTVVPSEEV